MANTFITPSIIARTALATLYDTSVMAQLVWRDFDEAFSGKQGDTVNVKIPATFTAEAFARPAGITLQTATESSTPLALDKLPNVSFAVTDEEMTLDISDFSAQLLTPAMQAIVEFIDADLAEVLVDAAEGVGGGGTVTKGGSAAASTVFTGELGAKAKLSRAAAPMSERYAVLSPEGAGVALTDELFVRADASGTTTGLREGSVGRVFGFDTYETQVFGVGGGDKGNADGVAFHRSAVALAMRQLQTPKGIASSQSATESYKALSLRVVYAYNNAQKQDEISVDCLYGRKALRPELAVQLSFGVGS